jgi:hypothetical protein
MAAFWDTALCSLAEVYRRFREWYCIHRPDDGGSTHIAESCHIQTRRRENLKSHFTHIIYLHM